MKGHAMPAKTLDARGLKCPLPVLRARKAIRGLGKGEELEVLATDPGAVKPGNIMASTAQVYNDPNSKLSEAQISALVRYLQGLK